MQQNGFREITDRVRAIMITLYTALHVGCIILLISCLIFASESLVRDNLTHLAANRRNSVSARQEQPLQQPTTSAQKNRISMSGDAVPNDNVEVLGKQEIISEDNQQEEILPLPAPGDVTESRKLQLGESITLDEMGPIIVNTDGTLRRIENWQNMTSAEQKTTLRLISARNKKRIEALRQQEAEAATTKNAENKPAVHAEEVSERKEGLSDPDAGDS